MHIAEGFLPPLQAAAWFVVVTPFVVHGTMAVVEQTHKDPDSKLPLAAAGAFAFTLSVVKLPSVMGLSSHPTGTGAGVVLFKPPVLVPLGTIVPFSQAILLTHGGLTTLGANVFFMAIVGPWCGYSMWVLFKKVNKMVAVFFAMAVTDLSTYVVTNFQLVIAYPGTEGSSGATLVKFMSIFALTQIPLALAEGVLSVFLFPFLTRVVSSELPKLGVSFRKDMEAVS